jgi:hypothetical protein
MRYTFCSNRYESKTMLAKQTLLGSGRSSMPDDNKQKMFDRLMA